MGGGCLPNTERARTQLHLLECVRLEVEGGRVLEGDPTGPGWGFLGMGAEQEQAPERFEHCQEK